MSIEDVKKYGQMIAERPEVRARAKEIGLNDVPGQIAYAKTLGFEFTKEDMANAAKEAGLSTPELSDEQLQKIAGGLVDMANPAALAVLTAASPSALISDNTSIPIGTVVTGERGGW